MNIKKTQSGQKNKDTDCFLKITAVQVLACGMMLLLVFAVCRLSPDGGTSIKDGYNRIMLTDISFSQVWSSVKEVAEYVIKPIDVDDVNWINGQSEAVTQENEEQTTSSSVDEKTEAETTPRETKRQNDVAMVMASFSDESKINVPVHGRISSYFGGRNDPISGEYEQHNAIDIAVEEGTNVCAAWDGVVSETGYDSVKGEYIWLVHKNASETFYCHCSEILVEEGTVIRGGETIALSGNTGNSTGPHLHFAVKKNGGFVDPLDYLEEIDGRI